ncbi:MAG: hypothetical protein ACT4OZ_03955 [Gemmatimonadota bacterium]
MPLWPLLAPIDGERLATARVQVQNAARLLLPAAGAFAWRPRDSSMYLETNGAGSGARGRGVALRIRDLTLILEEEEPAEDHTQEFPLHGRATAEVLSWLSGIAGNHDSAGSAQVFDGRDAEALEALATWFDIGFRIAAGARRADTETTGVVVDSISLTIARRNALSSASSILTGMTPGDSQQLLPYFEVRPEPATFPRESVRPAIPGAEWSEIGAILPAGSVWSWTTAEEQEERTLEFIDKAYLACCDLLGEEP